MAGVGSGQPVRPLATLLAVIVAGTVACARRWAIAGAGIAAAGLGALVLLDFSGANAWVVELAVVWDFFSLGYRLTSRDRAAGLAVSVCWVAASLATGIDTPPGRAGLGAGGGMANVAFWGLSGILPFAVGRLLATRRALNRDLEVAVDQLQAEQAARARLAAANERSKMARELHDVVAHSVSVMVMQTSGARRVAPYDLEMARQALRVVEEAGREALVELRRIVGVLRRGPADSEDVVTPGLAQLESLIERMRLAGLTVEFSVEGQAYAVPAGLQLTVYRVAQEALTNVIKHAASAPVHVVLRFGEREVALEVRDHGPTLVTGHKGHSGHGLVGMRERVSLYGGDLYAGSGAGGFVVRAAIPVDGRELTPSPLARPEPRPGTADTPTSPPLPHPWLDPVLALAFFGLTGVTTLVRVGSWPVRVRDIVALAVMTAACGWRRSRPLWSAVIAVAPAFALSSQMAPRNSIATALYLGLIPAYSVAAWGSRRVAWLGLCLLLSASALAQVFLHHVSASNYSGPMFTISVAWACGRAVSTRRLDSLRLERTAMRLNAEHDVWAELAVAGERSRIARELHTIVAHSVSAMVVQSEVARSQLDRDLTAADEAFEQIVVTGRQALDEMRRVLGVLRRQDEREDLLPQPCIDQIYALVQAARERGVPVEFSVTGEPGAVSAGVELGIYRIIEDTCNSLAGQTNCAVAATLRFADAFVELQLSVTGANLANWPLSSIQHRIAFCGGEVSTVLPDGTSDAHLRARLPLAPIGALA
ncbi:MAG TPA: histidine kinase [Acidimicrobiales bacterium]|nr:histidine kinase [Acidimicrobiales bacterium]